MASPARAANRGGAPAQERELRAQGRKTMRKLLDAGMVVFERRGYHAARVDDIVKVARTSHGTFYLYFSNKEDLFRALLADVARELTALAESLPERIAPGAEGYTALREWLSRFIEIYGHYGPVIRAWTEADVDDSDIGALGEEVTGEFASALIGRLSAAAVDVAHPQLAALATIAMIERFNYYVVSRRIDADRDDILDTLATILHAGVFGGKRRRAPAGR
jgi:AcrR family transcriptional regulator